MDPVAIEGRGELREIKSRADATYDVVLNIPLDMLPVAQALMPWVLDEIEFVLVNKTRNPVKGGRPVSEDRPRNNQGGGQPVVYFVQDVETGNIKIGFTTNMGSRFSALQTSTPHRLELLATIPGSRATEAQMQNRFKDLRVEGEWFRGGEQLMQYVEQVACKIKTSSEG